MEVDIYIKEANGGRELRIPWLPDKVTVDSNGLRAASYEILDVGEVKVPSGSNLTGFSWGSYFPGAGHKNLPFLRGSWQDPKNIQTMLSEWRVNGTPLRLLMTGTPINHDVYLSDYRVDYESGYGDYKYEISFEMRREIKIVSSQAAKPSGGGGGSAPPSKSGGKTYTIKSGDTLWGIAQRFYKSGAKYRTIYNANKTIIEQTAKKRGKKSSDGGHWIFPGTVITIP